MAFLFPGGESDDAPRDPVVITVAFAGPERGWLEMLLPLHMLDAIAVNMLGLDETQPPAADQKADAVKEILNVICGNLLPLIDDPKAVYSVSPPVIEPDTPAHGQAPAASARVALEIGTVVLHLFQESHAPAPVAP